MGFWNLLQDGLVSRVIYSAPSHEKSTLYAVAGTVGFYLLTMIVSYLLGSLNTAVLVSRGVFHDDVRNHGSGNAGLTNMLRTFGKKGAVLTLTGDIIKTVLAIMTGGLLLGLQYVAGFSLGMGGYLAAFFCSFGHIFPVFSRFKGGKGVLTTSVAILILNPYVFLVILLVFIIVVAFTRYVSLGSMIGALMYPLFLDRIARIVFSGNRMPYYVYVYSLVIAFVVIVMHRSNIKRLWRGEESKFSFHKKTEVSNDNQGDNGMS